MLLFWLALLVSVFGSPQVAANVPIRPLSARANHEIPGHPPSNLFDGNLATKWAANPDRDGKNVVAFDFGGVIELTGVIVYHAQAGGETPNLNTEDFRIETGPSADGPWTLLFLVTDNLDDRTVRTFAPARTRFVRLVVDDAMSMVKIGARNDDNIARIPEVEFFGTRLSGSGATPPYANAATPPSAAPAQDVRPPFERVAGGQAPAPVATIPAPFTPGAAQSPIQAPPIFAPASTQPAASAAPTAVPFPFESFRNGASAGPAPAAATPTPWLTDPQAAGRLATQQGKNILVFFRSDESRRQAAADAILLDPALLPVLMKSNVLLVVDLKNRPQDGAPFGVVRAPTLSQWSPAGKELNRLTGDEITRQAIWARLRL